MIVSNLVSVSAGFYGEQKTNMQAVPIMGRRPNHTQEQILSKEDLKEMSRKFALLSEPALRELYQRAYRDCLVVNSRQLPTARAIQELVQAWKQLRKWRKP